jgi:hypothetical protein
MKIIQNNSHGILCTCYTSLLIIESIVEIPPKLSPGDGQLHSFRWYEFVSLLSSFLTSEKQVSQSQVW